MMKSSKGFFLAFAVQMPLFDASAIRPTKPTAKELKEQRQHMSNNFVFNEKKLLHGHRLIVLHKSWVQPVPNNASESVAKPEKNLRVWVLTSFPGVSSEQTIKKQTNKQKKLKKGRISDNFCLEMWLQWLWIIDNNIDTKQTRCPSVCWQESSRNSIQTAEGRVRWEGSLNMLHRGISITCYASHVVFFSPHLLTQ